MYRRLNHPSDLWIAGILSAIFFCLVVAVGGSGGSWRVATPNVVPPIPYSGGMDVSHQPSTRFLVNPNRHVVVSASKSDKGLGLDHGGGPDPAILPDEIALPENFSEKQFVAVVQHALNINETSGYHARAPPALI
ncbi:hypothetical protein [Pseudaminobacter salicylatoxidans]|uniref:hypothetical protein n=1 Tax=Pseudaminobacter salicylatoxidans TaxID=93369 RepID=UPI0012F6C8AC|nr:hypothetical protein [Pseudaminobacter salicylatoxidans]